MKSILLFSKIFLISSVPVTSWSAQRPNIFFPKVETFFFLCLGLFIFGLGESILVISENGVTPWTVLAEGVAKIINIGIKTNTTSKYNIGISLFLTDNSASFVAAFIGISLKNLTDLLIFRKLTSQN